MSLTSPSFQPVGYNVGLYLHFHNWCKAIKWPFLFHVAKNATKMCMCEWFHLCWEWTSTTDIMDSFSCHSKLHKMKVVLCIKPHVTLGVKDFKHKNCIVWLLSKSTKKIDYLKYIVAYLCSIATEILNIPYQSIYLSIHFNC